MIHYGCSLFTWANRTVHSLSKWYAKFRTGKFHSGIVFFIWKISSFNRKTAAIALNWYQRWLWRNGTRIFVWNIPSRKNKTTVSDVLLLREIFWWNDSKNRVPFTSQPDFPETFLHMVNKNAQRDFPYPFCAGTFLGESNTERRKQLLRSGYLSPHLCFKIE